MVRRRLVQLFMLSFVSLFLFACGGSLTPVVPAGQIHFYRNTDFIAPALGISTDFVLYEGTQAQKDAIAARYTSMFIENETFVALTELPILKEAYAKVGGTELGLIDNYILPTGNYYHIAASDVRLVQAAVVVDPNVGIVRGTGVEKGAVSYTLLLPGIHRALSEQVHYLPTGPLRYRLISPDLITNASACQSQMCETTLGGVLTSDIAVPVRVDLEVNFELVFDEDNLPRLYELRDINTILTTYFSSPIRTKGKVLWSDMPPNLMQTGAGQAQMSADLMKMMEAEVVGQPIRIISAGVRGVTLPEDYLASQGAGAVLEQSLLTQNRLSEMSQEATATAGQFSRDQEQLQTEHLATQMRSLREALDSNDPIVICGILNFFRPGSCIPAMPVSVSVDQPG